MTKIDNEIDDDPVKESEMVNKQVEYNKKNEQD